MFKAEDYEFFYKPLRKRYEKEGLDINFYLQTIKRLYIYSHLDNYEIDLFKEISSGNLTEIIVTEGDYETVINVYLQYAFSDESIAHIRLVKLSTKKMRYRIFNIYAHQIVDILFDDTKQSLDLTLVLKCKVWQVKKHKSILNLP